MKIGVCYDTKSDYGIQEDNLDYTDFVSFNTVSEIKRALEQCGHTVEYVGNVNKLRRRLETNSLNIDLVFNIAEGFGSRNREALIPSLLEIYNIPCTASDAYGMALNLNKHHTKILAASIGVPVPRGIYFDQVDSTIIDCVNEIGFPLVLKLNSEGGSMGVVLINNEEEFIKESTRLISFYHSELLAEEYISGKEITVPIIGNKNDAKSLGIVLITHEDGRNVSIYDSHMKSIDNDIIHSLKTGLSQETEREISRYSIDIHRFFGLRDYSRMDFRVTPDGKPYFLEINTMPSLCRDGSFELCGKSAGLEYHEVIGKIVTAASKRCNIIVND